MEDQIDGRTKLMEDQTDGRTKVMRDKSDFSVETEQNQGLICRLISREIY